MKIKRGGAALRALGAVALAAACATPAMAQQVDKYRVAVMGIPVGTMVVENTIDGDKYKAKTEFQTTGVVAVVREVSFRMRSRGRGQGYDLDPRFFAEKMNTGKRKSRGKVEFGKEDARWDPNSAMVAVLADRPVEQGCGFNASVFDGKRTNQLTIREAQKSGDRLVCSGSFTRTGGYTAKQLGFKKGYTFTVQYTKSGGKYVFAEAETVTDYGRVLVKPQ